MVLGAGTAFAEPSVEITKVKLADARNGTVEYAYTVSGDFEDWNWDLIVKVTSDDGTKAAVLTIKDVTAGTVNTNVNVKGLLGKAYPGVSFFAELKKVGVQLWADGPYFAECNVGATKPEEYGGLYTFIGDKAKEAAESFRKGWRLPTKAEFLALLKDENCDRNATSLNGVRGFRFSGKGAYSSKSIFIPAAGEDFGRGYRYKAGEEGFCWTSDSAGGDYAWTLAQNLTSANTTHILCSWGLSVRAVRGAAE